MKRHVLIFGVVGGLLIVTLQYTEYRFVVIEHSVELYGALVARGLSNREIAAQLFVSENTVKTHCSRAFDKLGAARRTQAVQRGKELGLLP